MRKINLECNGGTFGKLLSLEVGEKVGVVYFERGVKVAKVFECKSKVKEIQHKEEQEQ